MTLFRNLEEGKARKIVSDLIKMGVIARFEDPNAEPEFLSDTDNFSETEPVYTRGMRVGALQDHLMEKGVDYFHMLRDKSKEIYLKMLGNT